MKFVYLFTTHGQVHQAALGLDPANSQRAVAWFEGRAYRPGDPLDGGRIIGASCLRG